jgi:hypothetical protein
LDHQKEFEQWRQREQDLTTHYQLRIESLESHIGGTREVETIRKLQQHNIELDQQKKFMLEELNELRFYLSLLNNTKESFERSTQIKL